MACEKVFMRGLLTFCFCCFIFFGFSFKSHAAVNSNVPDIVWVTDKVSDVKDLSVYKPVSDCYHSVGEYYQTSEFVELDFVLNFYAKKDITPYACTNLNFKFNIDSFDHKEAPLGSLSYSLVVGGHEISLPGTNGWVFIPSISPPMSYFTLKVHYAGYINLIGTADGNAPDSRVRFDRKVKLDVSLVDWNLYQASDIPEENNRLLQNLLKENISINNSVNQGNQLQEQGNQLQEQSNQLQAENNKIQSGILGKITDFFNGFFDNLGKTVMGWIIPTSEELTVFLGEINTWFSARLGFIWYPFDLAIRLVNAFAGGTPDQNFTCPSLVLNIAGTQYTIFDGLTFDIDAFGIFNFVRMFTSFLLCAGVVRLAVIKWDEWIGGHGTG